MKQLDLIQEVEKASGEFQAEAEQLGRARRELAEAEQDHAVAERAYDAAAHRHFRGEMSAEEEEQARAKIGTVQARIDRLRRIIPAQEQRVQDKEEALAFAKRQAVPAVIAAGQAEADPLLDRIMGCYEQITTLREQLNEVLMRVREDCRKLGDPHGNININLLPRIEAWNNRTGKRLFLS